jgi:hypothetical protein
VQDSNDKQYLVKFMEAISPGTKAKTEEVTPQTDGTTGDNTAANPENQTKERVKVPVQAFLNMLNTATGGVVQVTANQRSIVASAISYMALNALADWTLDKVPYGEYFK